MFRLSPFRPRALVAAALLALIAAVAQSQHSQTSVMAQSSSAAPVSSAPVSSGPVSSGLLNAAVRDALAAERAGQAQAAASAWQRVVKLQPRNAQAYAHLGLALAHLERYPEAIAAYRKAQAMNPALPSLALNLGLALFKSGDFKAAEPVFADQLKLHPDDQRLTILLGMSHYGAHDYKGAILPLKTAAARDQRNLELRLALAHCYLWTRQFQSVLDVYREILLINPDSAEADMIAGEALDEKGDNAGAEVQFRAAEKANPKEPNVHFGLAYLLWTQKRYDEAIPEFQAELANDPDNYQAMIYLGDTYVHLLNYPEAKKYLEMALKYPYPEPRIPLDLGIVYQETGQKEMAVKEYLRTIEMEPDFVNAHFRLAQLYRTMGKTEEAKAEFAKASSLNKKADKALYEKIADANARPAGQPPAATTAPTQPNPTAQTPDAQSPAATQPN